MSEGVSDNSDAAGVTDLIGQAGMLREIDVEEANWGTDLERKYCWVSGHEITHFKPPNWRICTVLADILLFQVSLTVLLRHMLPQWTSSESNKRCIW